MKINIKHTCEDFTSFRAEKVKSLFNAENGHTWEHTAELPIEGDDWQIGLIVGPSGSGKTSIGKQLWNGIGITNLSESASRTGKLSILKKINNIEINHK